MMKRRNTALFLAILSLAMVSCKSADPDKETTQVSVSDSAAVTQQEEEVDFSQMSFLERIRYSNAQISDDLPKETYGGETFTVWLKSPNPSTYMATEENGEVLNDASYSQKRTIEERFDLNIEYFCYADGWDTGMKMFTSNLMAGDYFADIVENWNCTTANSIAQGFFQDLSGYSSINTDKPWYFQDDVQSSSYKGHIYTLTGFMNTRNAVGRMTCTLFNKDMVRDYQLEDMYQVVRDGRWTADYVMAIAKDFYYDVNGNDKRDMDDHYGLISDPVNCWYNAMSELDVPLLEVHTDGSYSIALYENAEKAQTILDMMKELNDCDGNMYGLDRKMIVNDYFGVGNALFYFADLNDMNRIKDVDFDYGVLPRFKLNEAQETYNTTALYDPWAIPTSVKSGERAAIIMTAFAAEGYKQVLPVFYETTIKTKNVVDEESGEMIDLMMKNVRGEPMFYFHDYNKFAYHNIVAKYVATNKGFASFAESQKKVINGAVETILEGYEALETE